MALFRIYLVQFFCLFSIIRGIAQEQLLPVFKSGKWAVVDTTLKQIYSYKYTDLKVVKKQFVIVEEKLIYGVLDKLSNIIIPFEYDEIIDAPGTYFIVQKKGAYGIRNTQNKTIVDCQYRDIIIPNDEIAFVKNQDGWHLINFSNKQISQAYTKIKFIDKQLLLLEIDSLKCLYDYKTDRKSRLYKTITKETDQLFFCTDNTDRKFVLFENNIQNHFQTNAFYYNRLNSTQFACRINDSLLIVDLSGNIITKFNAQSIRIYSPYQKQTMSSLFSEQSYLIDNQGKLGLINSDFEIIIDPVYDRIWQNNFGFEVSVNNLIGLINQSGNVLVPVKYKYIVSSGEYWLVTDSLGWGVIFNGKEVIKPKYDNIRVVFNNRFVVSNGSNYGMIDINGRQLLPFEYKFIQAARKCLIVRKNKNYGLASINGNLLVPPKYEEISELNPDYLKFMEKSLAGIVRFDGKIVAKPQFKEINATENDQLFYVYQNYFEEFTLQELKHTFDLDITIPKSDNRKVYYKTGLINVHGQILLEPEYFYPQITDDFEGNTVIVKKKSEVIVITFEDNGQLIDKTSFKNYIFVKNKKPVPTKNIWLQGDRNDDFLYGLFTPRGRMIIDYKYSSISRQFLNQPDIVMTYSKGGKAGIVNERSGKIILDAVYSVFYLSDFKKAQVARCLTSSGRAALIDSGANPVMKSIAYIDDFERAYARVNKGGQLTYENDFSHKLYLRHGKDYYPPRKDYQKGDDIICKGGKWGIIDTTGNWVIEPQYSFIQSFANNIFIAEKNKKWGGLSKEQNILIDFIYDDLRYFYDTVISYWASIPYLKALKGGKWGVLDLKGNVVIDFQYDDIEHIISKGKIYFKTLTDSKKIFFGLVDKTGKIVLEPKYEYIDSFTNGFAPVRISNRCWKFVNRDMKLFPQECFFDVRSFNDGLAAVRTNKGWGFINEKGKIVIPGQYYEVGDYHEGLARISLYMPAKLLGLIKGKRVYALIDDKGKMVLNTKSSYCTDVSDGKIIIKKKKKYKLITTDGKAVLSGTYNKIIVNEGYNLYLVQNKNKQFALYNNNAEEIVPYGKYKSFSPFSEGFSYVTGIESGFIDTLGRIAIKIEGKKAGDFKEGLAAIEFKEGWGYIDINGDTVIKPQYSNAWEFKNGMAKVISDGKVIYINSNGEQTKPKNIVEDEEFQVFSNNGFKGIKNNSGSIIIYPAANEIGLFSRNVAPVGIQKMYALYNSEGKQLVSPEYMIITLNNDGYIKLINLSELKYIK